MTIRNNRSFSRHAHSLFISMAVPTRFFQVTEAIILANEVLQNQEFYCRIAAHDAFDMADVSPDIVAELMFETQVRMTVQPYYAINSHLHVDGYDDGNCPSAIPLNIWQLNRPAASICNSLIHRCVHAVNEYNSQYSFGHGRLGAAGAANTAPFWIGALAESMVSGNEMRPFGLEHDAEQALRKNKSREIDIDGVHGFSQSMWLTC